MKLLDLPPEIMCVVLEHLMLSEATEHASHNAFGLLMQYGALDPYLDALIRELLFGSKNLHRQFERIDGLELTLDESLNILTRLYDPAAAPGQQRSRRIDGVITRLAKDLKIPPSKAIEQFLPQILEILLNQVSLKSVCVEVDPEYTESYLYFSNLRIDISTEKTLPLYTKTVAFCNKLKLLETLIDQAGEGPLPGFDSENSFWEEALYHACLRGASSCVEKLLTSKHTLDFKQLVYETKTAMWAACWKGHVDIVEMLLEEGMSLDVPDRYYSNPIVAAATRGHLAVVRLLLAWDTRISFDDMGYLNWERCPPRWSENSGAYRRPILSKCPLMAALRHGHAIVAEVILHHASLDYPLRNYISSEMIRRAFRFAAWRGLINLIRLFVPLRLKIRNPIDLATQGGNLDFLVAIFRPEHAALLPLQADRGEMLNDALHRACSAGHADIAAFLVQQGASLRACKTPALGGTSKYLYCYTPLLTAIMHGHTATVRFLLDVGVNPQGGWCDCKRSQMSPLIVAIFKGHAQIASELLAVGGRALFATQQIWSSQWQPYLELSAEQVAADFRPIDIQELLEKEGAQRCAPVHNPRWYRTHRIFYCKPDGTWY